MSDPDRTEPGERQGKLKVERIGENAITCFRMAGTIDEQFDGKGLLGQVRGGTVVLDLGGIEKISSFGIREWVDFAAKLAQKAQAVYFVECAPKVIDQCNMVANFASGAKIVSFFAPYRCDYCDDERRRLLQVDLDREAIKSGKLPERVCEACGNPEYFDEDPLTFFSHLQGQGEVVLSDEVQAFLASRLSFVAGGGQRKLKIDKQIDGRTTFVRLSGDLDAGFPREKLAEGLEGEVIFDLTALGKIDPAGAAEWRKLVREVTPSVDKIRIVAATPAFVERLGAPSDLGTKSDLVSFAMPYSCAACRTTAARLIDVGQHYEVIRFATPPELKCADCGGAVVSAASDGLLTQMATLPKPAIDDAVRGQIAKLQAEAAARAAPRAPGGPAGGAQAQVAAAGGRSLTTALVSAVVALVVAVGVVVGRGMMKGRGGVGGEEKIEASATSPPPWTAARVVREGGRQLFVGRGEPAADLAEATERADEAALDELAVQLGAELGGAKGPFAEHVAPLYRTVRERALADLARAREEARAGGDGAELEKGRRFVGQARHRVAEAIKKSGAGLLPVERSDLYWEKVKTAQGTRVVAWARWGLEEAAWKRLGGRYTAPEEALGAKALTYFPSLGWRFEPVEGAVAIQVAAGSPLRLAGVQEGDLLLTTLDRVIHDGPAWRKQVEEETKKLSATGGVLTIQVKRGEGAPFETRLRIDPKGAATAESAHKSVDRPVKTPKGPAVRGNIWDDNPDE